MGEYQSISRTFSALADPTRRAVLQQLMQGPARVTELAQPHDISLNSVSKHLRMLESADLIRRDIRGRDHWIRFNGEPLREAQDWVTSMQEFWESRLDALESLLTSEDAGRKNNATKKHRI